MHNDFHIALLLFAWVSIGLTTFAALDAATRLPGGSAVAKRRNWRLACAAILGVGLWSGLWLAQIGLHRQVGASPGAPILATLITALAASVAAFSILLPDAPHANANAPLHRRSLAFGTLALGIGLLAMELHLARPWVHEDALTLQRAVLGWGGGTLVLGAGVCLAMCMAFHTPPALRRAAVGLRARAAAVLATSAMLSLLAWPSMAAWPADEATAHIVPIIMLSAGGVLLALGLHAALIMLETRVDTTQAHLAASLARVTSQAPMPQHHDTLTGLPNRLQLRQALDTAILSSTRRGRPFALFYVDLDNFGQINEQHGRNAGDRVLQIIAERLRQTMRGEDVVARLGGDEFGILVEGLSLPEAAATIGDKLLFRLRESVEVDGRRVRATASIGVVIHPQARAILEGASPMPAGSFGALKFLANVVSYWASIPGGIFSPALAVGAGIGQNIAALVPGAEPSAVVLLGMAGYLAAVTQAPLTSAIISMELTDNREMVIPILAVCMLARAVSSLLCRTPVYKAIAHRLVRDFERHRT